MLKFCNVSGADKKFNLQNIDFHLPKGYIMGLAGKNGAGKTTLIDYIVNPQKRYTGTILLDGKDIRENHENIMNDIGFVSEENEFFMERTAAQNAEIMGVLYKEFNYDKFAETMKEMGISQKLTVGKMSRGEYMKFQMAFAMAHNSKLYLLDEVTAGMDVVFRIDFFRILSQVIEDEMASVLMTTHIKSEMEQRMDYIGMLEHGKIVSFGTADIINGGENNGFEKNREI